MVRITTALIGAALLAPSTASAADIELAFTLTEADQSVHHAVVFRDVQEGPQPGILVTMPDGAKRRLDMSATRLEAKAEGQNDQIRFAFQILEHSTDRKGRETATIVSSPIVVTNIGHPATVKQGAMTPVEGAEEGTFTESSFEVELVWLEEAEG